ncbi:MAG: thiamine phosphate synthase [Candidatus Pacebacteria bacterium]|nr:thiamine phosphate synthase [Candidatus Paceibacterota bacterium]MDD5721981.1 thiamine phosphate synthase [Candidatus Paceibacterota bacterium]
MANLIPVINTKTIQKLKERIRLLQELDGLFQIDIADGKFTAWKTWNSPEVLKKIKKIEKKFELHLMVHNPELVLPYWLEVAPKRVIIHLEAIKDFDLLLSLCKEKETELGIAINPETPFENLDQYLSKINFVTILGVSPGPSGQKFQWFVLDRIKKIKSKLPHIRCEIDGGINEENIREVKKSGVDFVAIGSAIFKDKDPLERIMYFQNILADSESN